MMRIFCLGTLAAFCLLVMTACPPHDQEQAQPAGFNHPTKKPTPEPTEEPSPTPGTASHETPAPSAPPPQQPVDYPYATPEPGHPGFVKSPYQPDAGLIDVRGMSPGQQARDPYTQKIFLVP